MVLSHFKLHQSSFLKRKTLNECSRRMIPVSPDDIKTGPDGDIYVADMYEQRIDHSSHYAGRIDKKTGRPVDVGKSSSGERQGVSTPSSLAHFDYSKKSSAELIQLLDHPQSGIVRTAMRLLGDIAIRASLSL